MLFAGQLRAARALIGWNQLELAKKAKVGIATIRRLEAQRSVLRGMSDTIWKIRKTLEEAGIVFIEGDESAGPGVRLSKPVPDNN
jgi:transcriptional regulator with XRE-family HTH domain